LSVIEVNINFVWHFSHCCQQHEHFTWYHIILWYMKSTGPNAKSHTFGLTKNIILKNNWLIGMILC